VGLGGQCEFCFLKVVCVHQQEGCSSCFEHLEQLSLHQLSVRWLVGSQRSQDLDEVVRYLVDEGADSFVFFVRASLRLITNWSVELLVHSEYSWRSSGRRIFGKVELLMRKLLEKDTHAQNWAKIYKA